jgi:uncharacterized protein
MLMLIFRLQATLCERARWAPLSRRGWGLLPLLFLLLLSGNLPQARAASFPCEKASSAAEKLVCQDGEVSVLDEVLGRRYAAARLVLKGAQACLTEDQRIWLLKERAACTDTLCLKRTYLQRLAQLDALQPGATANRNLDLPAVPALVWVVPPAADSVAAPRGSQSRRAAPLAMRGKLLDEIKGGDGFWLQTSAYTRHMIVPLMLLEADTALTLSELARDGNARFEVLGSAAADDAGAQAAAPPKPGASPVANGNGNASANANANASKSSLASAAPKAAAGRVVPPGPHFDNSRCTFIYRVPASQASNLSIRGARP